MNIPTHTLARIAVALTALAIVVPAARAGHAQPVRRGLADFGAAQQLAHDSTPATPKRGCADFGLVFDYNSGCVAPRTAQAAATNSTSGESLPASVQRGCSDFGLVFDYRNGCVAPRVARAPAATSGFHWRDAGVGAGATLGLILIIAGLGAAHVVRAPQRHRTSS
jgi:hypothetical protein